MWRIGIVALLLAGCSGDGDHPQSFTGPTEPQIHVNCENALDSGNTAINVNVDCGDRSVKDVRKGVE